MSDNRKEAAALLAPIAEMHAKGVKPAADAWVDALRDLRAVPQDQPAPHEPTLRAACVLFKAAESLAKDSKRVADELRDLIAASFASTGCPGVYIPGYSVKPAEAAQTVIITDATAIAAHHPDLMTEPRPPEPDRTTIGKVLREGFRVTGAELSNGGPPGVRFTKIPDKRSAAA